MTNVQERSRTRRQRVLDAALEVFTQHGYGDTAIDEIARASDTSKGGLYFHFPSKQALFLALLDEARWSCCDASKSRWSKSPIPFCAAMPRCVKCCMLSQATASWRGCLVEALGAGKEFNAKLNELHAAFAALIADCLDAAVAEGQIPPIDTRVAAYAGTAPSTMSSCAGC